MTRYCTLAYLKRCFLSAIAYGLGAEPNLCLNAIQSGIEPLGVHDPELWLNNSNTGYKSAARIIWRAKAGRQLSGYNHTSIPAVLYLAPN